jgi:hypothetical protein
MLSFEKSNIFSCIVQNDSLKLEMYLVIYDSITKTNIVDQSMMNFALQFSSCKVLAVLHKYTNEVFDKKVLKETKLDNEKISFLINNYGGVKEYFT